MPAYGGLSYQRRYGGHAPRVQRALESMNRARGTAYDVTSTSTVYADNLAFARCIDGAWSTNQRLSNQFIPSKMTSFVPRWEKILGLFPLPTDTDNDRRNRIAAKMSRIGLQPNLSRLQTILSAGLGPVFDAVEFNTVAGAVTWWPGGTPNTAAPWYSTVAHILIRTHVPTGYSEGDYYASVASVNAFMDSEVPAWVTWDWYRYDAVNNVKGFYLDSPHNLDNSVFDV